MILGVHPWWNPWIETETLGWTPWLFMGKKHHGYPWWLSHHHGLNIWSSPSDSRYPVQVKMPSPLKWSFETRRPNWGSFRWRNLSSHGGSTVVTLVVSRLKWSSMTTTAGWFGVPKTESGREKILKCFGKMSQVYLQESLEKKPAAWFISSS